MFLWSVSFQWKNPDFLSKNRDFLLKNAGFITKQDSDFAKLRMGCKYTDTQLQISLPNFKQMKLRWAYMYI